MREKKLICPIILCVLQFLIFSCGLGDSKNESLEVYDLGQLNGSCKFDTKKLGKILEEDIFDEIACLESNLNQFVDFVRREEPDYVNRVQLQRFVEKFFPENTSTIKDMLRLVFDLNSLLLKDPYDKIHVKNLKLFFNVFRVVNIEGRKLNEFYKGLDKNNYWERRNHIFSAIDGLVGKTLVIAKDRQSDFQSSLNINEFLENLKDILKRGHGADLNIDFIDRFLFLKKLFLGGEKNELSSIEFDDFLSRFPDLSRLVQDLAFSGGKVFNKDADRWSFFQDGLENITSHFKDHGLSELILTESELLEVVDKLTNEEYDMDNISSSLRPIKEKLIGGDSDQFTFGDINKVINWTIQMMEAFYFNEVTWDHLESTLLENRKITELNMPETADYDRVHPKRKAIHWKKFMQVTRQYRLFHDSNNRIAFSYEYQRSRTGYNLITVTRWLLGKLVVAYGTKRETGWTASKDELREVVYDLEGLLRELNFWQEDTERFITEVTGGSDNFMYQANGDTFAGVEEVSEYFTTVFSTSKIAKEVRDKIRNHCDVVDVETDGFDIPCFKQHFFSVFFNELNLESHYPMMKKYIEKIGASKTMQHLANMLNYSRIDNNPEVPMTKTDVSRLIIGLSNLETLVIRYDKDKNGILHRNELDVAYGTFKELIIQVGELDSKTKFLAKSIFLYMVKKMKKPEVLELLAFHFFGKKKDITATRYNVGAILSFFVGQD